MMDAKPFLTKNHFKSWIVSKKLIMAGERNTSDGFWDIPLTPSRNPTQSANDIAQMNDTKKQLAQFLHALCFSPAPSTFIKSIKMATLPPGQY